jgi:iron-sulfur cluster repair protein YtfE (RIC family)
MEELSLIRFGVMQFFAVLMSSRPFQPISTLLIKLVEALIQSEPEPDLKNLKRIKWIYEHTHSKVNEHLSIIELVVFRNLDKGINKEIEVGDKTFYLAELYNYLDEISKELTNVVIQIAKKYSIDMPMVSLGGGKGMTQTIGFSDEETTK